MKGWWVCVCFPNTSHRLPLRWVLSPNQITPCDEEAKGPWVWECVPPPPLTHTHTPSRLFSGYYLQRGCPEIVAIISTQPNVVSHSKKGLAVSGDVTDYCFCCSDTGDVRTWRLRCQRNWETEFAVLVKKFPGCQRCVLSLAGESILRYCFLVLWYQRLRIARSAIRVCFSADSLFTLRSLLTACSSRLIVCGFASRNLFRENQPQRWNQLLLSRREICGVPIRVLYDGA